MNKLDYRSKAGDILQIILGLIVICLDLSLIIKVWVQIKKFIARLLIIRIIFVIIYILLVLIQIILEDQVWF